MSGLAISVIDTAVTDFYEKGSPITIETKDLYLRSVQESDLGFFQNLYTDPVTMRLFADNEKRLENLGEEAWKAEQMKSAAGRVATFVKRWTVDRIPFSGFVIIKKDNLLPIGFIVAGFGENPGQLESATVITSTEQSKGYGTQARYALMHKYLPALIENHYRIYGFPLTADGAPVTELVATTRLDNIASDRVMRKNGMEKVGENQNKYGQERGVYRFAYVNPPVKV